MISKLYQAHWKVPMSRFLKIKWQNVEITARPTGLRSVWPISRLPYRTGDDITFTCKVKVDGEPPTYGFEVVTFRGERRSNLDTMRYEFQGKEYEFQIRLRTIPYSGEYIVDLIFANPSAWQPVRTERLMVTQVIQDYKPIMNTIKSIWSIVLLAIGAGLGLLGRWLFSIFEATKDMPVN